jgi:hypothetical protein
VDVGDDVVEPFVASGLSDEGVELVVFLDELAVAGTVADTVFIGSEVSHLLELFGVGPLGGECGGFGFEDELHLFEVVELGDGERSDDVTTEGDDADEAFMFEAAAGFANGSAAGAIEASELGLGERASWGKFALDDVLAELAVKGFYDAFHCDSTEEAMIRLCNRFSKDIRAVQ